ncbi:16826_t:CDS:2 [Acaulospora colombiana]|uniref:16826_t:CDS:1 n=1 Tax=Acaulospora colombiana TaxID=27376 RepID=A0ACA9LPC7_9GLOM|nr:16826_t:CDS:2 [Acaulospora colombiana]
MSEASSPAFSDLTGESVSNDETSSQQTAQKDDTTTSDDGVSSEDEGDQESSDDTDQFTAPKDNETQNNVNNGLDHQSQGLSTIEDEQKLKNNDTTSDTREVTESNGNIRKRKNESSNDSLENLEQKRENTFPSKKLNTSESELLAQRNGKNTDKFARNAIDGKKGIKPDNSMQVTFASYGHKAQKDFAGVRGKDFRAQKTKKKRGSYRGGKIDLQSHSIKFDNLDQI